MQLLRRDGAFPPKHLATLVMLMARLRHKPCAGFLAALAEVRHSL